MSNTNQLCKSRVAETLSGEIIAKFHSSCISHIGQSESSRNGQCAQDCVSRLGYVRAVSETPNNIRQIRQERGLTLQQLAALMPASRLDDAVDLSTISKLELGKRKLTSDWMMRIAEALNVQPAELLASNTYKPVRRVPLVGSIAAGNWREAIEDPIDLIPCRRGGPNTFALVVAGDSMDKKVPPGGEVFIDPDDKELRDGKYYAMMRVGDGDATFKQYRDGPPRLEPASNNTEHEPILLGAEPLVTLGRVVGMSSDL